MKMTFLKSLAVAGLLIVSLGAYAFQTAGVIFEISSSHINVNDIKFRLSPTVKVIRIDNQPGRQIDLKRGDKVAITTTVVNNIPQVTSIQVLENLDSNENEEPR